MSPASREKMRLAKLGKPGPWKGKQRPDISENQKGRRITEDAKIKMSLAKLGKPSPFKGIKPPEVLQWLTPFKKGHTPWVKGRKAPWFTGENNPKWKGGISRVYKTGYNSTEYKNWRTAVFSRDNYTCQEGRARKLHKLQIN